jgi:hypothetical protein
MPRHELLDPLQGVVLRSIVDDDDVAILACQGLKAGANGRSGVVSHDDSGATQHSFEEARIIIVGSLCPDKLQVCVGVGEKFAG